MNISNILLWTASLLLAVGGIIFGIIASLNSKNANEQLKKIMNERMTTEEASKFFFKYPSSVNLENRKIIAKLKKDLTWSKYNSLISATRLDPMPKRVSDYLQNTDFKELVDKYLFAKKELQNNFITITDSLEKLSKTTKITIKEKKELIKYHQKSISFLSNILKTYYWIEKGRHEK